jgi:hypothetical protein
MCCLFAAAGCAGATLPAPGSHHPANPKAQSAALSRPSGTLDIDEDNLPVPPPQMQTEGKMHMEDSHPAGSSAFEEGEKEK